MSQNKKSPKLMEAVESVDPTVTAKAIVEVLLDAEEDTAEIAADFIENEVGRFDWVNNWHVIKGKTNPVMKVQKYLETYGLIANPQAVVDAIDRMADENPGRWK